MSKESSHAEVESMRVERVQGKKQVAVAPTDPFDQCNFTTREGVDVSWKYGNIAEQWAYILVSSAANDLKKPTMIGVY